MAVLALTACTLATVVAATGQAAGPERHVLGPHLQRRLLSSQAPGRAVALSETTDLFVSAGSAEQVLRALSEQRVLDDDEGVFRPR